MPTPTLQVHTQFMSTGPDEHSAHNTIFYSANNAVDPANPDQYFNAIYYDWDSAKKPCAGPYTRTVNDLTLSNKPYTTCKEFQDLYTAQCWLFWKISPRDTDGRFFNKMVRGPPGQQPIRPPDCTFKNVYGSSTANRQRRTISRKPYATIIDNAAKKLKSTNDNNLQSPPTTTASSSSDFQ